MVLYKKEKEILSDFSLQFLEFLYNIFLQGSESYGFY